MSEPQVEVVADGAALADVAAARIEQMTVSAPEGERTRIALSGGHTPRATYQHLAARPIPWGRVELFFGDERCVPPDVDGSNYKMVKEALLGAVPIPEDQVHRVRGELEPAEAAADAERDLGETFGAGTPVFDLILLGMGPDGHTASLFPGSPDVDVTDRLAIPVNRPDLPQPWRVSLTLPVLNAAKHVMFLVDGSDKAPMLPRALAGDAALPSGRVRPAGDLTWLVTEVAAAQL
jgi:6-phosphogluconolactonase